MHEVFSISKHTFLIFSISFRTLWCTILFKISKYKQILKMVLICFINETPKLRLKTISIICLISYFTFYIIYTLFWVYSTIFSIVVNTVLITINIPYLTIWYSYFPIKICILHFTFHHCKSSILVKEENTNRNETILSYWMMNVYRISLNLSSIKKS